MEKVRPRGIYLLPNILTTAALFAGFYAIVAAMKGYLETAAVAILIAMVADGLDGRVARLTNTQTRFGAEYDSLSDMVSFGIAPALSVYSWALVSLGKVGWVVAFVYAAATALRLARFNTQVDHDVDRRYSQGLQCPSAAVAIATMVWLAGDYAIPGEYAAIPAAIITVFLAACMVSRVRYYSFKQIDFGGKVPFLAIVSIVPIIALVAIAPPQMLFIIFLLYAASGPIFTLSQMRRMRQRRSR